MIIKNYSKLLQCVLLSVYEPIVSLSKKFYLLTSVIRLVVLGEIGYNSAVKKYLRWWVTACGLTVDCFRATKGKKKPRLKYSVARVSHSFTNFANDFMLQSENRKQNTHTYASYVVLSTHYLLSQCHQATTYFGPTVFAPSQAFCSSPLSISSTLLGNLGVKSRLKVPIRSTRWIGYLAWYCLLQGHQMQHCPYHKVRYLYQFSSFIYILGSYYVYTVLVCCIF